MVKSLLLASAAGLVATAGAQAADLPVKAKAVEYVKICSLYGAGFYYIPGTDICLRIGGQLRAEYYFNTGTSNVTQIGQGIGTQTRDRDYYVTRMRNFIFTDSRSQTEYGTLRTFSTVRFEVANVPNNPSAAAPGTGIYGLANVGLDSAFIQWAGFTFGRAAVSFIDLPWSQYEANDSATPRGTSDTTGGAFLLAYTYVFGNGVTGTISLEDGKQSRRGIYGGGTLGNIAGTVIGAQATVASTTVNGGNHSPDVVGQIRADESWGTVQVGALARDNSMTYYSNGLAIPNTFQGHASDAWGYAAQAGIKINLPWGPGDAFWLSGSYSKGASDVTYSGNSSPTVFSLFNQGGGSGLAQGYLFDGIVNTNPAGGGVGGSIQLTTAWGANASIEHNWNDKWKTSLYGSYLGIRYGGEATSILCAKFGVGAVAGIAAQTATLGTFGAGSTCNMNWEMSQVGSRTRWMPVKDFTLDFEATWQRWYIHDTGTYTTPVGATPGLGFLPGGATYGFNNQNVFSGLFSVRRLF